MNKLTKVTVIVLLCSLCYQSGLTVAKLLKHGNSDYTPTPESNIDGLVWDAITATQGKGDLPRFVGIMCESVYQYKLPNTICEDDDLHSDAKDTVEMCKKESMQVNEFNTKFGNGQAFIECMMENYWRKGL